MDWPEYLDVIESAGYRYNVPALFSDPEVFDAFLDDLAATVDGGEIERVAGIDALGFVPGTALAQRFDAGLITIRKGGKLPIAETERLTESMVDYTGKKKTLELDRRRVPNGGRALVVDDWVETASQMDAAIDLLERAGAEVVGIAVLGAEETEETRRLDEEYGIHSVRPWRESEYEPER